MTIDTVPAADIAAFDGVRKGEPAPAWLSEGITRAWGLPAEPTHITLISVSENANFLVTVDGAPHAVTRVSRPGYLTDLAFVDGEISWVAAIRRDTELKVPAHLETVDGAFHALVLDPAGASWVCVTTAFIAGRVLEDVGEPAPHLTELGRASAVLHEHARHWSRPSGFQRFSWELPDMLGETARWGGWEAAPMEREQRELLRRAEEKAREVLGTLEQSPVNWGLIHADLRPSNVIIDRGELTIIDFDDAGFCWYLFDFAAALSFMEHTEHAPAMAQNWVAGYREVLDLSADELRTACALSMVRRLQMVGWTVTHRADALPEPLRLESIAGSCSVAERYLVDELWLLREQNG